MAASALWLVAALLLATTCARAFSTLNHRNRRSFVRLPRATSLSMISFPFFTSGAPVLADAPKAADKTIGIVKSFVSSNFGLIDSSDSLLANDVKVSGPTVYYTDKQKYLNALAKEQSAFLRAVPDYDVRAYSFAVDKYDNRKIWFKVRPRGTITGPFSYNGEVYLPNQKNIEFPIQQLSITVNNNGLISKMTTGYVIDKFVGNTNGLVGRDGLLYALDNIPNKFAYLPPAIVLKQFFSRNRRPQARSPRISPFPVAVMESLANAVIYSNFGAKNPSLLDSNFLFSTPFDGPYTKKEFVSKVAAQYDFKEAFPDFDYNAYNIEVDQYDPERVWLITKSSGTLKNDITRNGKVVVVASSQNLVAPPEAISMSFNEEGLCYKVSAGYVLDKLEGNSNGLGGYRGIIESVSGSIPVWEKTSYNDLIFQFNQAISGAFSSKPPTSSSSNVESANDKPPQNNQPVLKVDTSNLKTKLQAPVSKSEVSNVVSKPKIPVDNRPATPKPNPEIKKTDASKTKPTLDSLFGGKPDGVATSKSVAGKPIQKESPQSVQKLSVTKTNNASTTKSAPAVVTKAGGASATKAPPPVAKVESAGFFSFLGKKPEATVSASLNAPAGKSQPNKVETKKAEPVKASEAKRTEPVSYSGSLYGSRISSKSSVAPVSKSPEAPVASAKTTKVETTDMKKAEPVKVQSKAIEVKLVEPAVKTPAPVVSKAPVASAKTTNSISLSSAAVKAITSVTSDPTAVTKIDAALKGFETNTVGTESLFKTIVTVLGSKDDALAVLPYCIGSLPRGDQKTSLNNYYQQFV